MLFLAIGAQAGSVALRPRLCSAGRARVAAVWGPANKEAMRQAFLASGKPSAAAAFENVTKLLDEHAGRWLAGYADACEATQVRGEQSAEVLDLRMTCLNDDLEGVRAITGVLSEGNPAVMDRSVRAASALDDLGRCADVAQLRGALQLPKDPFARKTAEGLRRKLREATALKESEQCEKAMSIADAVIVESDAISYCPTRAEALAIKGLCSNPGEPQYGIAFNEQSFVSAEACGHARAAAMASANLVYSEGQTNPAAGERWGNICRAELERIGGDRQIEGWLLTNLSALRYWQGRFEEARQLASRAVALKESWLGLEALDVAISEDNLAIATARLGRLDEALEINRRAQAKVERLLGRDHLESAMYASNEGEILLELGQTERARERLAEALRIYANNSVDDERVAFPLTGLGRVAIESRDVSTARVLLERALKVRLKGRGATVDLAETRFQLARALGTEGSPRGRACKLARDSFAIYSGSPGYTKERNEVEAWLARATCRRSESLGEPG